MPIKKSSSKIKLTIKQSSLKTSTYKKIKPFKKESYEKKKAFKRKVILGTGLSAIGLTALGAILYNKYKKRNRIQN
jgi:adenylylsulfate kinase-like enzyme